MAHHSQPASRQTAANILGQMDKTIDQMLPNAPQLEPLTRNDHCVAAGRAIGGRHAEQLQVVVVA